MADQKASVLVVEDDQAVREMIKQQISQFDVVIHEAEDGQRAVELATSVSPDLIILDLALPVADGFEVVSVLREVQATRTIPMVVYTARDLTSDDKTRLTLGLTQHLTKATTSEADFVKAVKTLLNGLVAK